ncbi:MAG TPA: class I SAM-dependent methyltransferase [Candidatus Methylomirabilis sp.]|nr:class I SAM-dependent methyltransferase [Candidatus Methylomirabilis sp.]
MSRESLPKKPAAIALACALVATVAFAWRTPADAVGEMARLAKLMDWKQGTVVADIGAGDGRYSFAAAEIVGASGRVFATEIDEEKLRTLRSEVKERKLRNVEVVVSADAATNLPEACCDAIFLRRVYHHLTKPLEFDASLLRSLKPGGKLAIIDFPPHPEYGKVKGVPKDREDHGIQRKILIDEVTKAGFALDKVADDWPTSDYCVVFQKK